MERRIRLSFITAIAFAGTVVAHCAQAATISGKRFLTGNSLRKTVISETKKPALKERIEITRATEKHGKDMLIIKRRPA